MSILPDFQIRNLRALEPRVENPWYKLPRYVLEPWSERSKHRGMSYGLSMAGYDIRAAETVTLGAGTGWRAVMNAVRHRVTDEGNPSSFSLLSSIEHFVMPDDVMAIVHDKSTWAREGLTVQNTVIEPGWHGHLTLEVNNQSHRNVTIHAGDPIAQIVFHQLNAKPQRTYDGKYQGQSAGAVAARYEGHTEAA
ncbi:dCTP deaminase [Methylobacterium sp. 285MFTsu5.1]|uniref:dCTP deaminase n=1 Tax=Methylobacterium sp. 285MFTsu5.1 TaxID=1172187 RepID=UPI0003719DB0|nr:dCTP deaminase [Methylobacterium sp. 285MFTsu5.1]